MRIKYNILFLLILFLFFYFFAFVINAQESEIKVFIIKHEDGKIDFFAKNPHPHFYNFEIVFNVLKNYNSSVTLPYKGFIKENIKKKYLFTISPISNTDIEYSYKCNFISEKIISDDNTNSDFPEFTNCLEEKKVSLCIVLSESQTNKLDTSFFDYEWELGDGTIMKGEKIRYCYKNYGEYEIKLNVYDKFSGENLYNVAQNTIILKKENGLFFNVKETCKIDDKIACDNVIIDLKNYSSNIFYWDFGDGTKSTSTGNNAEHAYKEAGDYKIKLGVISDNGNNKHCIYKKIKVLN